MNPDIKIQLQGNGEPVLKTIGMSHHIFGKPNQPCIFCSTDKKSDRASWIRAGEVYFCRQCGCWSVMDLAMHHLNMDYKDTAAYLRRNVLGNIKSTPKIPINMENRRNRYRSIVKNCVKISPDNAGGRYLAKRGLTVSPEKDCLFHPALEYYEDKELIGRFPALVSIVRTSTNESSTLHITYIDDEGNKANVPHQKKILPVIHSYKGGAIRLFQVKDIMAVAEGVESALAFYEDEGIPAWSVINAGNMASFEPPDGIKKIYIIADEDESGTGVKTAYSLLNRLKLEGIVQPCVVRLLDGKPYYDYGCKMDYNDYLILKKHEISNT